MKIFDTFQKLWNYCLYCPICKNYNRNINVSVGPDDNFELMGCCKVGSEVRILCKYYHQGWRGSSCLITFIINTTNNTYEVKTSGTPPATDVAKDSYFFCYLQIYSCLVKLFFITFKINSIFLSRAFDSRLNLSYF